MNRAGLIALFLCFVLLMSACSLEQPSNYDTLPYTFQDSSDSGSLRNGRLIYTITKFWIVDNVVDIPEEGGIRGTSQCYYYYYTEDGDAELIRFPDCVLEDGSFAGGTYMVMVEFTVTSEDAENWTDTDRYEDGRLRGSVFTDPYNFSLANIARVAPEGAEYHVSASFEKAYYSALNDTDDHPYSFRLLPGETRTFVIGYFINCKSADENWDVSKLGLRVNTDETNESVFIPIGKNLSECE